MVGRWGSPLNSLLFFFSPLSSQIEGEAAPDCPLGLMLSRDLSWDLREKIEFSVTAWSSYLGH